MADVVQGRELCARRGLPSRPALACDKPRDSWALPRDVGGGEFGAWVPRRRPSTHPPLQ